MKIQSEGRLLRVTLDRVDKRNALNFETCEQLVEVIEAAGNDVGTGAILLDGEGPAFCAGMDLEEALREEADERLRIHASLFTVGMRLKKPLIAAVHGACLGGGVGLAASAHVVVAADNCRFALTEIRLGLWPFAIWKAIEGAFGERRALELSLTGRNFTAADAERWGLVHLLTSEAGLREQSSQLAVQMAEASPVALEERFGAGSRLPGSESGRRVGAGAAAAHGHFAERGLSRRRDRLARETSSPLALDFPQWAAVGYSNNR